MNPGSIHRLAAASIALFFLLCPIALGQYTITEYPGVTVGDTRDVIAPGPDGNIWFSEYSGGRLGRITTAGQIVEYVLPSGSLPSGVVAGPDGAVWYTDINRNAIGRITTAGAITEFPLTTCAPCNPMTITVGPDGALWFTEAWANRIGRITTAGVITEFTVGPAQYAGGYPLAITTGPDGALWFTEAWGNRIGRITVGGQITEYSNNLPAGSTNANYYWIAAGPDGNLWFTVSATNRIGRITPAGVFTDFATGLPAGSNPVSITAGPDGALWFTAVPGRQVGRITTAGVATLYSAGLAAGASTGGITLGPDGAVWFTDSGTRQIGRVANSLPPFTPPAFPRRPMLVITDIFNNRTILQPTAGNNDGTDDGSAARGKDVTAFAQNDPNANYGSFANGFMMSSNCNQSTGYNYLQFSTAGLPAADIASAKILVYTAVRVVNNLSPWAADPVFALRPVSSAWNEMAITANAQPSFDSGIASALTVSGVAGVPGADVEGWLSFDVTPLYISWVNGSRANYGVRLSHENAFCLNGPVAYIFTSDDGLTSLAYTGVTSGASGVPVTLSAKLQDTGLASFYGAVPPVAGKQVSFTAGGQSCSAGTDASGVASCSITLTGSGTQSIAVSFAGDTQYQASAATAQLVLSKPPSPAIAGMPSASCNIWPPNGKLVQVATVSASISSGALASFTVTGASSEPVNPGPDIVIAGAGLAPRVVQLRAERLGSGNGRVYTITATATSVLGVQTTATATCTVPHDQGK